VPIGAFAEVKSNGLYIDAFVGSVDGTLTFKAKTKGRKKDAEIIGRQLAEKFLEAGAKEILDDIYKNVRLK
jgi:hydroxymethylbilane synthase